MMSKQRSSKWFWPFWYVVVVSVPQMMRFLFWIFCFRFSNDWITFPKKSFQLRHTMRWLDKRKKTLSCPTDIWIGTIYSKKFRIQQMFVLLLFFMISLWGRACFSLYIYIFIYQTAYRCICLIWSFSLCCSFLSLTRTLFFAWYDPLSIGSFVFSVRNDVQTLLRIVFKCSFVIYLVCVQEIFF